MDQLKNLKLDISVFDIAKSISEGLARNAFCGTINGKVCDLRTIIK